MNRAAIILTNETTREKAVKWVRGVPTGTVMELRQSKRSIPQNSLMWCLLTELSQQLEWHGQRYSPEDWKDYMCHALKRARWMPSEDGGMVPIGMRTSEMTKGEMAELIELLYAFGSSHGVSFSEKAA